MSKQYYIIPIFVPHLGCPHACVFCNQRKITGQTTLPTPAEIKQTIYSYLQTIPVKSNKTIEVAFYGGSFTALPVEQQLELLEPATQVWRSGQIDGIRISTRPDCVSGELLALLHRQGVLTVELGAQSLDPSVLLESKRGHTPADIIRASQLVRQAGCRLGIQMMIGLPGDTRDKMLMTVRGVIRLAANFVRIYPALVLKDTVLHKLYMTGNYQPLSLSEAVNWSKDALILFSQMGIPVVRLGLQPTETLMAEGEVVAGPFHPAFGELVYSALVGEQAAELLRRWLTKLDPRPSGVVLFTPPQQVSPLVGHYRGNIKRIQAAWGLQEIKIEPLKELPALAIGVAAAGQKIPHMILTREEFLSSYRIK
ncbi:MAG: radical SAM protein [Firmicutes bacterium]|nr:radical SAM protein [Bacillota bacterium]